MLKKYKKKILDKIKQNKILKDITEEERERLNYSFIKEISPVGGIDFTDSKFISTGTGYEACLYIHKYPRDVADYWLNDIMATSNAICVLDIGTLNKSETISNVNKSLEEQRSRVNSAKKTSEAIDANDMYDELQDMYRELKSFSKVMKIINTRVYLPSGTKYDLDNKIKEVKAELEPDYSASVCINETKQEYLNAFLSYDKQQENIYARKGQPILASTLALGNPFHFSSLSDPYGSYLGETATGGTIFYDLFHYDDFRMSYNFLAVGKQGSGKSTLLKKIMKDRAIRGDYIRVFDVEGEFISLCKELGGKVISLDGSSNTSINILQILPSENNDIAYSEHLSKVKAIYKYMKKEASENELEVLEKILRILYIEYGILDEDGKATRNFADISSAEFPIFSDLVHLIKLILDNKAQYEGIIRAENIKELTNIETKFENLVNNYGSIFNRKTTMESIYNEPVIVFDISNLKNMDSSVFDAQLFSAISLVWANAISIGKIEKGKYEQGEKKLEDVIHGLLIIDESHYTINANKLEGVKVLNQMSRRGRKYFVGIGLASQRMSDYVPDNTTNEAYDELKNLFALTTYRFLMKQDESDVYKLQNIFGNALTATELEKIPVLERKQCILSIAGYKNIEIQKIVITDEEKRIFAGGR